MLQLFASQRPENIEKAEVVLLDAPVTDLRSIGVLQYAGGAAAWCCLPISCASLYCS